MLIGEVVSSCYMAFFGSNFWYDIGRDIGKLLFNAILGKLGARAAKTLAKRLGRKLGGDKGDSDGRGESASGNATPEPKSPTRPTEGPGCFLAGTLVLTESGYKPIEQIAVGDEVLSRDPATGAFAYKRVLKLNRGKAVEVCRVTIRPYRQGRSERHRVGRTPAGEADESEEPPSDGQDILSTRDHPYYSVTRRDWVDADHLWPGELLRAADGSLLEVVRVDWWAEEVRTYNFEVQEFHTYFAAGHPDSPGVWVHNGGPSPIGPHTVGPYKEVGGHHPHQQAARSDNPNYRPGDAISVADDGTYDHGAISKAQARLNAEARRSGEPYTLDVEEDIQIKAMKEGGIEEQHAKEILKRSREELERQGALEPTRAPGSRRKCKPD